MQGDLNPKVQRVTFAICYSMRGANCYSIAIDGYGQPFGSIFYSKRGDLKRYIVKAVKVMNAALEQGNNWCMIQGVPNPKFPDLDYRYIVDFKPLLNSVPGQWPHQVEIRRY